MNPLAAARYRDCSSVTRAESDAADARVLANILRTDVAAHRPLPAHTIKTRSGTRPRWSTDSAPTCASTTPPPSSRSTEPARLASIPALPARSWPRHPPRQQRPG
ncbi:hypothetical protein [Streptomyces sp. RB17]|uniref:hypothetical protein n=1 Tax=Streptomyces sp. RB17 TaxID=2585197 RepID=UPI00225E349A|nr:hypothetical protein [Streptomyces sp. RB17]